MSSKSKKSSSPNALNFKDLSIKDEKKIENVFELIDKLNPDMQREVFSKLLSYNPSNASNRNLPKVSKQFADVYLPSRRLSKIQPPEKPTIEQLSKITDKVIDTIGHLKIKKIIKSEPVVEELTNIFDNNFDNLYDEEFSDLLNQNKFADARRKYEQTNKKDFDKKVKEYHEQFNYLYSNPDYTFHRNKRDFDQFRWEIENYDKNITKDEKKKIDAYIKASDNITYAEYIKLTRELPIGAKVNKIIN